MKKLYRAVLPILLFFAGVLSVNALDLIILKNGTVIEAKVMEITPTEIRYKRPTNLNGPMIIIPANDVLSIRYENGTTDFIGGGGTGTTGAAAASGGTTGAPVPQPGTITPLQGILNTLPEIRVAGNRLKFDFTGDTWTAKINGENFSTGTLNIEMTGNGALLTLKQTHIWPGAVGKTAGKIAGMVPGGAVVTGALNAAGSIAGLAGAVEASGTEIVLQYQTVPSTKLSLVSINSGEKQPRQTKEKKQDESGQENKLVSVKFSLGLVINYYVSDNTEHTYYNNTDDFYSGSFLGFAPALSFRLLFSPENKLRFGTGVDVSYTFVKIQIASNTDDFGFASPGTLAPYGIIGYGTIFLHTGYDFAFGALYLAPSWAITNHLLIGVPMSLFGTNQRRPSVANSIYPPDYPPDDVMAHRTKRKSEHFLIGLSIQWVF